MPDFPKQLAAGRVGLGVLTLAAPAVAGKTLGLNLDSSPHAGLFARFVATRAIMLGAAVLAGGPGARSFAIKAGIGVDAGDALGAILEHKAGRITKQQGILGAAIGLGAVGIGVLSLSE